MEIITRSKRYLPHEITTRIHSVETYRQAKDWRFVCRKYKISKSSLMRWNKAYDGSRESLTDKSHRPHRQHPNAHTEEEIKWIKDYHHRNPDISVCELYGKLRTEKAYHRHPGSLYRVFVRLGYRKKTPSTKKKSRHLKPYDTPTKPGVKWQMDVKYVPMACYAGNDDQRFYQYTMIDEATRERFMYPYKEVSSYSTVDFIHRAIIYFQYFPHIIQTDNGSEFTHFKKTKMIHPMDIECARLQIVHQLLRPRTPWHNGKVERSHRNDQERFYNHMHFYSYEDLLQQMKRYLYRSNRIPMAVLGWLSPYQKRQALMQDP
ncbi:MAG: transposase [Clostridia bacterium]|nr:transposase [Clostridia bacterium]